MINTSVRQMTYAYSVFGAYRAVVIFWILNVLIKRSMAEELSALDRTIQQTSQRTAPIMKLKTLASAIVLSGATLIALPSMAADTIKVGVLHSLSGTMAISVGEEDRTIQPNELMARARLTPTWQIEQLAPQAREWLSHGPEEGNRLMLKGLEYPLTLKFIGHTEQQEALVKLEDGNLPTGPERLKVELALTERESHVLHWLANGKTNREIAEILEMSPRTVNKHLEQIFPKLGVENRTSAAGIALRIQAPD